MKSRIIKNSFLKWNLSLCINYINILMAENLFRHLLNHNGCPCWEIIPFDWPKWIFSWRKKMLKQKKVKLDPWGLLLSVATEIQKYQINY